MLRNVDIDLVYQPLIEGPPVAPEELYREACLGDKVTIDTWRKIWLDQYKKAVEKFGNLGDKTIGQLYGLDRHKPVICIASGPSLRYSLDALRENKSMEHPVTTVSCLHNFGLLEDEGCHADYYLSLDSGGVVIEDATESRNKDGGFYWEQTKGKKLLAFIASDPRLFELWQGEIYLFHCLVPDTTLREEFAKIQPFHHYLSAGGNAGGAVMYFARAVLGADPVILVGYDFCFDYDDKFHTYKTHYDQPGNYTLAVDVFGNKRKTWASYLRFKYWFDWVACKVPGTWVNASEGILGAYREGNIKQFQYKSLKDALVPYQVSERVYLEARDAQTQAIVDKKELRLKEFWGNVNSGNDVTFF